MVIRLKGNIVTQITTLVPERGSESKSWRIITGEVIRIVPGSDQKTPDQVWAEAVPDSRIKRTDGGITIIPLGTDKERTEDGFIRHRHGEDYELKPELVSGNRVCQQLGVTWSKER